ncbi:MAG TPA: VTT domain-containing protein, partial [Acidimicrobiia bacterium]|nr:VTT domain-containing protein [Acidimicrobiia bacterium]
LDPRDLLESFGPWATVGLFLIIFAETGLLIGFFLPGDSLLFTAGILASQGNLNIAVIAIGCFLAAVIGDQVGYTIGRRAGPALFRKPDSRIFKQKYVDRTKEFFEKHGPKTILLARFVPIVRTFAPVLAGVGEMSRRTFTTYNVVGAFVWGVGVTVAGYILGEAIGEDIDKYLLPIIAVIIVLSILPPVIEALRERRRTRNAAAASSAGNEDPETEVAELRQAVRDD